MAAWTWMRHSYCWHTTPSIIAKDAASWAGSYVELEGTTAGDDRLMMPIKNESGGPPTFVMNEAAKRFAEGQEVRVKGRLVDMGRFVGDGGQTVTGVLGLVIADERTGARGRYHPASLAGLIVGAMGVSIFVLYLRAWLRERKPAA
jgi:hypothetical protein